MGRAGEISFTVYGTVRYGIQHTVYSPFFTVYGTVRYGIGHTVYGIQSLPKPQLKCSSVADT